MKTLITILVLFLAVPVFAEPLDLTDINKWEVLNHEHPIQGICKVTVRHPEVKVVQFYVVSQNGRVLGYRYFKDELFLYVYEDGFVRKPVPPESIQEIKDDINQYLPKPEPKPEDRNDAL